MNLRYTAGKAFARLAMDPTAAKNIGRNITREEVERRLGPKAALSWDDLQAARVSFLRAAERYLNELSG